MGKAVSARHSASLSDENRSIWVLPKLNTAPALKFQGSATFGLSPIGEGGKELNVGTSVAFADKNRSILVLTDFVV